MISCVRVCNEQRGLKPSILLDFEQINVLCGRNNSGKSTLLEALNRQEMRVWGKRFSQRDVNLFYEDILSRRRIAQAGFFLDSLHSVVKEQGTWFTDQSSNFFNESCRKWSGLKQENIEKAGWDAGYKQLFPKDARSILIPAKRQLELNQNYDSSQGISAAGQGLLNQLFAAKNKSKNSDDCKRYNAIRDAFGRVSSGYHFDIYSVHSPKNEIQLFFSFREGTELPAPHWGLGLQDLLVILFFLYSPDFDLILIEEPESHIHPFMQKKLLREMRLHKEKQFILSTHSNVFLNSALIDRVYFTTFTDSIQVDDATARASILSDLGYSIADNLVTDVVILVEGPTDVPVLEEFLAKIGIAGGDLELRFWPMGGDIMDQMDLRVFDKSCILAVVDNDPTSNDIRERFVRNCTDAAIEVTRLKRYSIENYFTIRAIRKVFGSQVPDGVTSVDPGKKLSEQVGIDVKHNNRKIAREMTSEEITATEDLFGFIEKIQKTCAEVKGKKKV